VREAHRAVMPWMPCDAVMMAPLRDVMMARAVMRRMMKNPRERRLCDGGHGESEYASTHEGFPIVIEPSSPGALLFGESGSGLARRCG
jgi:hypothetical protein